MKDKVIEWMEKSAAIKNLVAQNQADIIAEAAEMILKAYRAGKKVLLAGNGGSAADAQHIAAELVNRFLKDRKALSAISLSTDTSILTAISNDYGFDGVFSRQIEALGDEGDVLLAITTSGASPNILKAIEEAHNRGMTVIVLTGEKGESLKSKAEIVIAVPSVETPKIQETHITIGHIICLLVEEGLFGE
ncbi:SIS domain-containing protein [Chloroflexota bacterium]